MDMSYTGSSAHKNPNPYKMRALHKLSDDEDRDRLVEILHTALSVAKPSQFFSWIQGPVHALLPHEILICGHASSGGALKLRYFSATRYFKPQHFDAACHPRNGLVTLAIRRWADERQPFLLPSQLSRPSRPSGDPQWSEMLVRLELKNLACHGVRGPSGAIQTWFGLGRVASLGARTAYLLELLIPCLAATYARVVAAENGVSPADIRVRSLLTPRETEVLEMLRAGLSNSQIAEHLALSAMTAKNHVQNIRVKLRVRTRGQAVVEAMKLGLISQASEEA